MITKIKTDQKALEKNLFLLELKNNELVSTQSQLLQAERFASIGKVVAGLAHEIGNPLGIIHGYIELLSDPDLPTDKRKDYSNRCLGELERISELMEKLLTQKTSQSHHPSKTDVIITCSEAINNLQKKFDQYNIKASLKFEKKPIIINISNSALYQVILNLLLNSIHAISQSTLTTGSIKIEIVDYYSHDTVSIIVKDNGPGINSEYNTKIFEPFFTTKQSSKGKGLGLYTCHQLLKNYDGTLKLKETSSQGTVFEIILPKK